MVMKHYVDETVTVAIAFLTVHCIGGYNFVCLNELKGC